MKNLPGDRDWLAYLTAVRSEGIEIPLWQGARKTAQA
jgi:hypothetical protein